MPRNRSRISDVDMAVSKILGVRSEQDRAAEDRAFRRIPDTTREIQVRTDGVVVTQKGRVLDFSNSVVTLEDGIMTIAAGDGDVVGPSSSVDGEIPLYDGITGKLLKRLSGSGIVQASSGVASVTTAPTITDFINAIHDHTDDSNGGVLSFSQDTGEGWMTPPGPVSINTTDKTNLATQQSGARFLGICPGPCTSVEIRVYVETAGATITWAEFGIATAPTMTSGNLTLMGSATGVAGTVNSTGAKGISITTTGVSTGLNGGEFVYLVFGSQASTVPQYRATPADFLSSGITRLASSTRPSTMAAPTAFSTSSAITGAIWVLFRYVP